MKEEERPNLPVCGSHATALLAIRSHSLQEAPGGNTKISRKNDQEASSHSPVTNPDVNETPPASIDLKGTLSEQKGVSSQLPLV